MSRVLLALLRIAVGAVFVGTGVTKFARHTHEQALFAHWGLPAPGSAVLVIGAIELVFGLLLMSGLATRLAALVLLCDMLGAFATAGRVDGGEYLIAPPLVALACIILAARGGGAWQLVDLVDPRPQ
jgi:uncharacterized membrane protein YphA (DoxX/SURF4 family)